MPREQQRRKAGAALTLAAWWCLLAALLLPPLSYLGYPFNSFEYIAAGLLALGLAGILFWLRAVPLFHKLLFFAITLLLALLYSYGLAAPYGWLAIAVAAALAVAFAALLIFDEPTALRVVAGASIAQIAVAAFSIPSGTTLEWDENAPRSDGRPVVHIILDEHSGLAAAPRDSRYAEALQLLQQRYVSAGFSIFPKAYTADNETRLSLGRLFNPDDDPSDVTGRQGMFKRAALLEEIGHNRKIHIAQFDYVRFDPWPLRYRLPVTRLRIFNSRNSYPGIVRFEVPAIDRLKLAASGVVAWAQISSGFPAIRWLMNDTRLGQAVANSIHVSRMSYSYIARAALIDYRHCCVFRGTYYFFHTYFPHQPYAFDRDCAPKPVSRWEGSKPVPETDTADLYRLRWAMLLEQELCASVDVMYIVKALDNQPHMRDAMIIIHGDHGSRIVTKSDAVAAELQLDDAARARDQRGTFLAIRDGQKPGSVIADEVRIDAVFEALVENDFQSLDLGKVRRYPDSPYSLPAK